MDGHYVVTREDWSLHRKGEIDRQRHQEKIKEALKKNLPDLVSEESIITSNGQKVIKVPIRTLDEYHFYYDQGKKTHAGQGDGKSKAGDVLANEPNAGSGQGKGAGEKPGLDYYEAEITVDELAEMVFEDLGLPNLKPKKKAELASEAVEFKDIRKKGISSNIDRKRTVLEAIKRGALSGQNGLTKITPDDLRFKTWELTHKEESNAVVLAMMDTSGSMDVYEKYIARSFFFWMVRFLRTKYQNVQIVFLAHHVTAAEVGEEEFFTKGASGGTRCSSVYKLALEIIKNRFNSQDYNLYAFHFSDGENLSTDNELCLALMKELLTQCNLVGYGEIENPSYGYGDSVLHLTLRKITDPRFISVIIKDKSYVYPALKNFFAQTTLNGT